MAQFEPYKKDIAALGTLVFVAAERRGRRYKNAVTHFQKHRSSFAYLLDEDRKVTKAYGVHERLTLESINIAKPATFIVAQDGRLAWLHLGTRTERASVTEILEEFKRAAQKR